MSHACVVVSAGTLVSYQKSQVEGPWSRVSAVTRELSIPLLLALTPKLMEWFLGHKHGSSQQEGREEARSAYDPEEAMGQRRT